MHLLSLHTIHVWHPKILFGFIKIFYLIWGGYLKFSSKRTLPLKKFLLCQVFCLDSPKTWLLVLEVFPSYLDSKPNAFHLGIFIWKNLLKSPMAIGVIFSPFKNPLMPWHEWKPPPISHLPSLCQHILQIQQVEPPHNFSSIYFLSKIISALYFGYWRFTKELPFLLWVLPPNQIH